MTTLCIDSREGLAMTRTIEDRARDAAAQRRGWKPATVRVKHVQRLSRDGCAVYAAMPTDRTAHAAAYFAELADGRLAGDDPRGDAAAAAVLRACGHGAPADWWAQIVSSFGDSVGGAVLTADGDPYAIRRLRERGVAFEPPALKAGAGGATELRFFAVEPDRDALLHVLARLGADGRLEVERRELPARG